MKLLMIMGVMLLCILLVSCIDERSAATKCAHRIFKETFKEIEEVYGLDPASIAEESDNIDRDKYKKMGLGFISQKKLSRDEGRRMVLDIAERFLHRLNTHEERDSFLGTVPFTIANIDISISIVPSDKSVVLPTEGVGFTWNGARNFIVFSYPIPEDEYSSHREFETLEEARAIINF